MTTDVEHLVDDTRADVRPDVSSDAEPDLLDRDGLRSLAMLIERTAERERATDPDDEDVTDREDPYAAATAEFYDLLATGHWDTFGAQLATLLADVDPSVGPVLDVGAGTGVGLTHLRDAVAGASIFAIEPSKAMRVALHARLTIDPTLRAITTVDPRPFASAELPVRACGVVASAVLGHLTDDERHRLWRYVADRLEPGAPAVIEVLPPYRPFEVEPVRYRELQVGRFTYEGWQSGRPADDDHMAWTMTYRVLDGDDLVAEHEVVCRWRCLGPDDIRAEVERYRLDVAQHDDCVVLTHA